MTVKEYIASKYQTIGFQISEADCLEISLNFDLDLDSEVSKNNIVKIQKAYVSSIPAILLSPSSISEGGVSISRAQRSDIEKYYSLQCKKLGIKNELIKKPKVKFI